MNHMIIGAIIPLIPGIPFTNGIRDLADGDYIGMAKAQSIAVDDAGIPPDKAQNVRTDMIKIDGEVYYKVQFTGSVTDYRYIINAETGKILTQVFYRLDKTQ